MSLINLLSDLSSFYPGNPFSQQYKGGNAYATPPYAIAKGSFDQKSLKFNVGTSSDRPGGGHSGQPFVTVSSKDSFDLPIEDLAHTGGKDMFIRGGTLVTKHIKNDVIRIGKFLTSSSGLLWIAQQNLLANSTTVTVANIDNVRKSQISSKAPKYIFGLEFLYKFLILILLSS